MSLKELADVLRGVGSAVIFTHSHPDGDAIGSGLALSRALSGLGIKTQVVCESELPAAFFCLEGAEEVRRYPTLDGECYISVDCSDENRLGELTKTFLKGVKRGKTTVNLDHHVSNTRFCKYNYVRESAANCENIFLLLKEMGVKLDRPIANALMAGLITDSGSFTHSDVNGDVFRAAAEICEAGADIGKLSYHLMKKQTKPRAELYARTISRLRFLLDDRLAVAVVTRSELDELGLKQDATSGIVDFGLTIEPVEVSVCIMEDKKGQYKASFRSKGKVNVNAVAGMFGGGGHILASGCMLFGEQEEVIDKLRYAVWQHMGEI